MGYWDVNELGPLVQDGEVLLTQTEVTRYWHPGYYTAVAYLLVHLRSCLSGLSGLINYSSIHASVRLSICPAYFGCLCLEQKE